MESETPSQQSTGGGGGGGSSWSAFLKVCAAPFLPLPGTARVWAMGRGTAGRLDLANAQSCLVDRVVQWRPVQPHRAPFYTLVHQPD